MTTLSSVKASLKAAMGDIVFGMEDGTVSIFGLVFGIALSATDSKTVLVAGATGAVAAAVSMMAGTYLDAESIRDAAQRAPAALPGAPDTGADTLLERIAARLAEGGMPKAQLDSLRGLLAGTPGWIKAFAAEIGPPAELADASPAMHATWMFVSNLFAGTVPVIPFAFLPLPAARLVCLAVTTMLLLALGIGRGIVAGKNVARTAIETLTIAAAAAGAGILIARMVA